MIAVDTNLLVYSHRPESLFHRAAKELIEQLRGGAGPWAIPWPCVHEFLCIVTHAGIFKTPASLAKAFASVDAWRAGGNVHLLGESDGYFEKLQEITSAAQLRGPRIHDARVAAICLHHGVSELWTADRDFSKFPQLRTRNPLVKS
jgi:toxin-antitoxin system PIN domain toxin